LERLSEIRAADVMPHAAVLNRRFAGFRAVFAQELTHIVHLNFVINQRLTSDRGDRIHETSATLFRRVAGHITLKLMDTLFTLLASPGVLVGSVVGIALAFAFHRWAPSGVDTVTASALLIVVSAGAGLAWELLFREKRK